MSDQVEIGGVVFDFSVYSGSRRSDIIDGLEAIASEFSGVPGPVLIVQKTGGYGPASNILVPPTIFIADDFDSYSYNVEDGGLFEVSIERALLHEIYHLSEPGSSEESIIESVNDALSEPPRDINDQRVVYGITVRGNNEFSFDQPITVAVNRSDASNFGLPGGVTIEELRSDHLVFTNVTAIRSTEDGLLVTGEYNGSEVTVDIKFSEIDGRNVLTEAVETTNFDGVTIKTVYEFDENGEKTNERIDAIGPDGKPLVGDQIGRIFGSAIGGALLNGQNQFVRILGTSFITTIARNIGESLNLTLLSEDLLKIGATADIADATEIAFDDFTSDFAAQLKSASIGAVSSYLTAELIDVLGLDGFGGQLATTVGNTVINRVLTNIVHNATLAVGEQARGLFDGTGGALPGAIGSFLGSKLASEILSAETAAGQLGGSIGGSLGSLIGGKIVSSLALKGVGKFIGGLIIPGIGALIGTLLGTLIGDLFGKTPRSGADLAYDAESGEFVVGAAYKRGKASRETARQLAGQVGESLNGIIAATGGVLFNPEDVEPGHYGMYKSKFRYQTERGSSQILFDEAGSLVTYGVFTALRDAEILGGDVYIKRALDKSIENQFIGGSLHARLNDANDLNDPEIEALIGDLSIARDFASYQENSAIINALIASAPDSAFAAGWIITLQRAYELGLHRRAESDWHGGWEFFFDGENALTGTAVLSIDNATGERLISFTDESGTQRVLGDTVDSLGKDDIRGTSGADTIVVNGARVNAGASSSGITVDGEALAATGHDIDGVAAIRGGAGNDVIWGGDRGNDIYGEAGDDTLYGGKTADWLFGGDGNDTLDAVENDSGNYLDGGAGNDTLIGRGGSDWLDGGAGADTLDGGDGGDFLRGGAGAGDDVRGGRGDDVYLYDIGDGADTLSDEGFAQAAPERPAQTVQIQFHGGYQSFRRIEALSLGYIGINWSPRESEWEPTFGDFAPSAVTAQGKAQGGEDRLVFGPGVLLENIRLRRDVDGGGVADDLLIEILDSNGALTGDVVRLADWFDPFNRVEWLEFADGQEIRLGDFLSFTVGTDGDDIIFGTDGNDFIHGGAGNDILHLLRGDDVGNGGLGDDFITGDGGADIVIGGNDNDRVLGGSGDDVVSGDLGDDIVRGDSGDDILSGGLGNDTVVGGAGDDVFKYTRGDGRDVILDAYSSTGWTVLFNGAAGWVSGVTFADVDHDNDPTTGLVSQIFYNGDVIFDGDDWHGAFKFNTTSNVLQRHDGDAVGDLGANDTLEFEIGIELADLVFQNSGDDLIVGINRAFSDNETFGSLGDQITLKGWNSAGGRGIENFAFYNAGLIDIDAFTVMAGGGDGADLVIGGGGRDWLTGGAGDDEIRGGAGDDLLVGHGGEDHLKGSSGADTLLGGSGDDILDGGAGGDVLVGGAGFDIASYASATSGVTVKLQNANALSQNQSTDQFSSIEGLEGSSFADTLIGDDNDNDIIGGGGADRLEGGAGDDRYIIGAGDGDDVISDRGVDESSINQQTALNAFGAVSSGFTEEFTLVDAEPQSGGVVEYTYLWKLTHTASGDTAYQELRTFFASQSSAPNVFNPNNWQNGFAPTGQGSEVARTVGSATYFDGGVDAILWEANDSFSNLTFAQSGSNLTISGAQNSVVIEGFANNISRIEEFSLADGVAANLDNIIFNGVGGSEVDFLVGNNSANTLNGAGGDDILSGSGGDDTLSGGEGDDILEGGAGGDNLQGGAGIDAARYNGSSSGVTVNLATGAASGGEAAGDILSGVEVLYGSSHADNLTGDSANNRLFGGEGNDVIAGGDGADVIVGEDGADTVSGGAGDDNIDGGDGADSIHGDAGVDALLGGAGNDHLYGDGGADFLSGEDGDDILDGGADDDLLAGDAGNDTLRGGDGDDTLIGGAGDDQLEGGLGADIYEFEAGGGDDVIIDTQGANHIVLAGATRENVRFDRSGNHLDISVLGGSGSLRINNYFAAGGSTAHRVTAGDHTLYLGHASNFFSLFNALPAGATALNAAITDELDRYWHLFGEARPDGADISLATDEDVAVVGAVVVEDHDNNITDYAISVDADFGGVALDSATGAFTYTPGADYYGQDVFEIVVNDASGHQEFILVTVSIAPVNDAPASVAFTGAASIDENAVDITLGDLAVIDVDGVANEHTISVDDARFEIVNDTLRLRPGAALDFETEASVTVHLTATDAAGASNTPTAYTFTVNDLNEGPTVGNESLSIGEHASLGASVGVFDNVSDPDGGQFGELRYYFQTTAGAAAVSEDGMLAIDSVTGEITINQGNAFDYETATSFQHFVIVRDNAGVGAYNESVGQLDLSILNVNEAPTDISLSNNDVDENADGAVIGVVSAADPDGPSGGAFSDHAFTVDDARFYVDGANNLRLKAGETLNFEAESSIAVNVTATDEDGAGLSFTKQFVIDVNDQIDVLTGGSASDVIIGEFGVDHIFGLGGDDDLQGAAGDDVIEGGAGVDTIDGGEGADDLDGGDGDDVIAGGAGADQLVGGAGADDLSGGADNDILDGGANNDVLDGGAGDDQLSGGAENDRLIGGAGADALDGGLGEDTASYQSATAGVTIDLANGANNTGDAAGDTFASIEIIEGSEYADNFSGDANGNVFHGLGGNDTILGDGGNDVLYGGDGDDFIDAGDGLDVIDGGAGSDILIGGADQDLYMISRNSGVDIIRNYDPLNADDTISFADDISYTDLWFERVGDDLVISVVGSNSETTIEGWYAGVGAGNNYDISLFLVDDRETVSVDAEQLVSVMAQHLTDTGTAKPQTAAEMANALSVIGGVVDSLWGFSTPPTIEAIGDMSINEDGQLEITVRIYDDKVAAQLLEVDAFTSNAGLVDVSDIVIGAANAQGDRLITVTPKADVSGIASITLRARDGGSGYSEEAFTLTVSAVADAPSLAVGPASGNTDTAIALTIAASQTDADLSETLSVEVSGVPAGAALSAGVDQGGGVWLLTPAQLAGLTITPAAGDASDFILTVRAITSEGGSTNFSEMPLNVSVNGAPTDIAFSGSVDENVANGTVVGDASHTDPDAGGSHVYSLVNNAGGRFAINGANGVVTVANGALLNHEANASHTIRIRVEDQSGLAREENFTVAVNNVNETPTDIYPIGGSVPQLAENAANGTEVVNFNHSDPDIGDGATWALTNNAGGRFAINATYGIVTVANTALIDYESATSHTITVRVTDTGGFSRTENFTVSIGNVNEAPTDIWPSGGTNNFNTTPLLENVGNGTVVGDFNHSDPEGGGTYSLTNSAGGRFAINATSGVLTVANASAIDYESATAHTISVRVSDGELSRTENFTVTIGDVNEAPTVTSISTSAHTTKPSTWTIDMPENKAHRDWDVAFLNGSDPEGNALNYYFRHSNGTYSTTSQDGRFKIVAGRRIEVAASTLSYESTPNSLTYTVAARDTGTLYSANRNITIRIKDVNETPSISGATFNRAENWNPTVSIGTVSFSDPDSSSSSNGQVSLSIISGNTGNKFRIDSAGRLWLNSALNYEVASQRNFTLKVRARDRNGSGLYRDANVYVNVTNINEAPIVTKVQPIFINDNYNGFMEQRADIDAYDPDGTSITYAFHSVVSGNINASRVNVNSAGTVWLDRFGFQYGTVKIRISSGGHNIYRNVNLSYETTGPGGGGPLYPIVLDLDGDGVELLSPEESGVDFDVDLDGELEATGWSNGDDGLLALDRNGNGVIDDGSEISFINDLEGAESDLEGLVAYDTNNNGALDAGDDAWGVFRIWRDANLNGVSETGELFSLEEAGIESISLTRALTGIEAVDGQNNISAFSEFTRVDGSVGEVADVSFYYYEFNEGDGAPITFSAAEFEAFVAQQRAEIAAATQDVAIDRIDDEGIARGAEAAIEAAPASAETPEVAATVASGAAPDDPLAARLSGGDDLQLMYEDLVSLVEGRIAINDEAAGRASGEFVEASLAAAFAGDPTSDATPQAVAVERISPSEADEALGGSLANLVQAMASFDRYGHDGEITRAARAEALEDARIGLSVPSI